MMSDPWRCNVTGNPVGTDTWTVGGGCTCQGCRAANEIAALRRRAETAEALVRELAVNHIVLDDEGDEICMHCGVVQVEKDWHRDRCPITRAREAGILELRADGPQQEDEW